MDTHEKTEHLNLTTRIVSAYVTKNPVAVADLRHLIAGVYHSLATAEEQVTPRLKPAVPVKKSVTPAHIICLEDGTKHKTIKRHLRTAHQMTPEEYREKWGLGSDYSMVAPDYSVQRSKIAKKLGLGTRGQVKKRKPKNRA